MTTTQPTRTMLPTNNTTAAATINRGHTSNSSNHKDSAHFVWSNNSSSSMIVRNVFALNNIGVRLLQKGYYRYALETFKDALSIVKSSIQLQQHEEHEGQPASSSSSSSYKTDGNGVNVHTPSSSSSSTTITSTQLMEQINQAYHRAIQLVVSNPTRNSLSSSNTTTDTTSDLSNFIVSIVTWSSTSSCCYHHHHPDDNDNDSDPTSTQTKKIIQAIRIEDIDFTRSCPSLFSSSPDDCPTEGSDIVSNGSNLRMLSILERYNFELALLIHNLAVANMCFAARSYPRTANNTPNSSTCTSGTRPDLDDGDAHTKDVLPVVPSYLNPSNEDQDEKVVITETSSNRSRSLGLIPRDRVLSSSAIPPSIARSKDVQNQKSLVLAGVLFRNAAALALKELDGANDTSSASSTFQNMTPSSVLLVENSLLSNIGIVQVIIDNIQCLVGLLDHLELITNIPVINDTRSLDHSISRLEFVITKLQRIQSFLGVAVSSFASTSTTVPTSDSRHQQYAVKSSLITFHSLSPAA